MCRWDITDRNIMKKILVILLCVFGFCACLSAQDIRISNAKVITKNGSYQRKKISITVTLTSEGMRKVYDEGEKISYQIEADWSISAYLKKNPIENTFYPIVNSGARMKNAEIVEFECVDYDAVERIAKRGVSVDDFTISSTVR